MISFHKVARFQLDYHNLLERDLDCRYVSINEEVSNEILIQVLNKQFGLSRLRQFYEPKYRSSQNKCVNLRLVKSLFPRDLDVC